MIVRQAPSRLARRTLGEGDLRQCGELILSSGERIAGLLGTTPPPPPPVSSLHQDLARARPPAQYTPLARGLCVYPELLCLGTDAHHWAIGTTAGFGVRIF